ncbi:degenerin-like protein asic-2 [Penaeus vannamei]|uniref:degenerin-like protein asic-2 n=1 Tax=Penaeus vannamei TaxID=6689 RepID=UPI00387F8373
MRTLCTAIVSKSIEEESIQCDCPLPCSEMTYDAQVTTSQPNNLYYNILSDTRKELKSLCSNDSQMVSLLVYLDSKSYTVTEESPAYSVSLRLCPLLCQWDTLLSNIGGSLGLFIGVSLISILEMIEMIIDFIVIGFRRCTGRGKKISQTSAAAWQGKIEVVERLMDRQHNRYEQLRKELIKDIINDLKQNNDESFSSTRVHPNSTADRGNLDASRVFSLVFLRDEQ